MMGATTAARSARPAGPTRATRATRATGPTGPTRAPQRYQLDSGLGRLTPAERAVRGKAARAEVPLESHAGFEPGPDRPDPIALLEEQAATRVPELVPIRYGRMLVSPFTYYRGAALPMASRPGRHARHRGWRVQLCGDAHLSNFGVFGSPERSLVFDLNDFDETLPGPWEWDVKRLAASLEVAGARQRACPARSGARSCAAAVGRYREAMRALRRLTNLDVWYAHADVDEFRRSSASQLRPRHAQARATRAWPRRETRDSLQAVGQADPPGGRRAADRQPTRRCSSRSTSSSPDEDRRGLERS